MSQSSRAQSGEVGLRFAGSCATRRKRAVGAKPVLTSADRALGSVVSSSFMQVKEQGDG
jgi:hypothetical protein